jgi:hypothetical protein
MKQKRGPVTFAGLGAGESATLHFEMRGCFVFDTFEFEFDARDPGWMRFRAPRDRVECRAEASADDLAAYDRVLADWRRHPHGHNMGTTDCDATVTWRFADGRTEVETFEHAFVDSRHAMDWSRVLVARPRKLVLDARRPQETGKDH